MASYHYQQPFDAAIATVPLAGEDGPEEGAGGVGGGGSGGFQTLQDGAFAGQPLPSLMTERFPLQTQYEDRWAALAFGGQLLLTLVWAVSASGRIREETAAGLDRYDGFAVTMLFSAFWAIVLSLGWLYAMTRLPDTFVMTSGFAQTALCLVAAILVLSKGYVIAGVVGLALGAANGLWLLAVRDRVSFAGLVLEQCGRVVSMYAGVALLALGALLALLVYVVCWAAVVQDVLTLQTTIWMPLLLAMFFWTAQVLQNLIFTTVSGVMASWYFMLTYQMEDPTYPCLRRAATTSFGSVCLGSLGSAAVRVAEVVARSGSGGNPALALALQQLQDVVDRAMQSFNVYAFVHVAVYGKPYTYAAMDTVHLMRQRGLSPLVGDSLIHPLAVLTALVGGVAIGSLVALTSAAPPAFLCAWLVAASAGGVTLSVVSAAVVTLFVCFAEEPDTLRLTNPDLHQRLSHALAGLQDDL